MRRQLEFGAEEAAMIAGVGVLVVLARRRTLGGQQIARRRTGVRSSLAQAKDIESLPEVLAFLALSEDPRILLAVAANPATPPEVLARLLDSPVSGVTRALARNPNSPIEVLLHLAPIVPKEVLKNPALELIFYTMTAESEAIETALRDAPITPAEELRARRLGERFADEKVAVGYRVPHGWKYSWTKSNGLPLASEWAALEVAMRYPPWPSAGKSLPWRASNAFLIAYLERLYESAPSRPPTEEEYLLERPTGAYEGYSTWENFHIILEFSNDAKKAAAINGKSASEIKAYAYRVYPSGIVGLSPYIRLRFVDWEEVARDVAED